jgi:hypothetical protein
MLEEQGLLIDASCDKIKDMVTTTPRGKPAIIVTDQPW